MWRRLPILLCIPVLYGFSATARFIGQEEVDALYAAAKTQGESAPDALACLERIAFGRPEELASDAEAKFRLAPGSLHSKQLKLDLVRNYAISQIGEIGSPQAIDFLARVTQADLEPDLGSNWVAVRIALGTAQLRLIPDPAMKIDFLKRALRSDSTPPWWATEQLCNAGAADMLAEIKASVRKQTSDGADEIRFCEARIEVLARDPDRLQALATVLDSVLRLARTGDGQKLIRWAISEIKMIGSDAAYAKLREFDRELKALTDADPSYDGLWNARNAVDSALGRYVQ